MLKFDYIKPETLKKASKFLAEHSDTARILAGGTDLIVRIHDKVLSAKGGSPHTAVRIASGGKPEYVVDIKHLPELRKLEYSPRKGLTIGSAITFNEIINFKPALENFNILVQAAKSIGAHQVRNRATIGGNICNAAPSADIAPALLVLDSEVDIFSVKGKRTVNITEFFAGPGQTVLKFGEIVTAIRVPKIKTKNFGVYLKHQRREALDLAGVSVAVLVLRKKENLSGIEARIALGAVAPTPIRVKEAETILNKEGLTDSAIDKASNLAKQICKPISDLRASKEYREEMVEVLTRRALEIAKRESRVMSRGVRPHGT